MTEHIRWLITEPNWIKRFRLSNSTAGAIANLTFTIQTYFTLEPANIVQVELE